MFLERRRPVRRPAAPTTRRSPRTPPTRRARRKTTTRARAPRPREGEASRRARSASASHKTRRSPGGGDPRRSRSRGGRHPALASRTFPRGQGHRGTATTEALGRRARLGAASLAATPRDALTCRRPSSPPRVSGRALASGRHAPRKPVAVQACALRACDTTSIGDLEVETVGPRPKSAQHPSRGPFGHKASRARGRQRPTPSPSPFRARRHDDCGPARRVTRELGRSEPPRRTSLTPDFCGP